MGLSLLFLQNPSPQRQRAVQQPTHRVGAGAPLTSLDLGPAVAAGQTGGLQRWGGLWVCMCPEPGVGSRTASNSSGTAARFRNKPVF